MTAWEPIASETPATAEHGFSPAFEVARPPGAAGPDGAPPPTPLVFASPHSGRLYPPDMMAAARLTAQDLRGSEDAFVDDLIAGAPALGASVIRARLACRSRCSSASSHTAQPLRARPATAVRATQRLKASRKRPPRAGNLTRSRAPSGVPTAPPYRFLAPGSP